MASMAGGTFFGLLGATGPLTWHIAIDRLAIESDAGPASLLIEPLRWPARSPIELEGASHETLVAREDTLALVYVGEHEEAELLSLAISKVSAEHVTVMAMIDFDRQQVQAGGRLDNLGIIVSGRADPRAALAEHFDVDSLQSAASPDGSERFSFRAS